jgi:hypothetical protein
MTRFTWVLLIVACKGKRDYDGDGWSEPEDCDDGNALIYPGAEEVAYDGLDQDCSGGDLVDRDGDGYQAVEAGGPDCNDFDPDSHPGAKEIPYDGVDQNCDDWNDNDFDLDGYEAMGHGGEDCDDNDPVIIPIDLDGDGYSPCTGDCDESDPRRNEEALPVCGNGFDDDCDDVSDCTIVGVLPLESVAVGLIGSEGTTWFGTQLLAPGDLDGDGQPDLVVTGQRGEDQWKVFFVDADLQTTLDDTSAWARLDVPHEVQLYEVGDTDGDGQPDLGVSTTRVGSAPPSFWVLSAPDPGEPSLEGQARLTLQGGSGDEVGSAVSRLDDQLVIGASGRSRVQILPADTAGTRAFGDDGARIDGADDRGAGEGLLAYDADGDGQQDLLIVEQGDPFGFGSGLYLVTDVPTSGVHDLDSLATARIDTRDWGPSSSETALGDLDGDGKADPVVAAPFADGSTGSVVVLLETPQGDSEIADLPLQRLGLGDDTFGWSVMAEDFDGDGQADLTVGAPSAWGGEGGAYKPGAVHLWYGPLEATVEHTFTADLLIQGSYLADARTFHGYAMAMIDVDGDGGEDLLTTTPLLGPGQVNVLPGGLTGLYGF